jgi:uncharacterized repeat protein (TIGR03803 family)
VINRSCFTGLLIVASLLWGSRPAAAQVVTPLYTFDGADGSHPVGELVQAQDGLFYGTTREGGAAGFGTIYKITAGGLLTTLHSFSGAVDGAFPEGALLAGPDGYLYGTTSERGPGGAGTIFRIALTGELSTLFAFDGAVDGGTPRAGLTLHSGLLYGLASRGGVAGLGVLFSLTPEGAYTRLHDFRGPDGAGPVGELASVGQTLFGTASGGGAHGQGTIFLTTPAGGFVKLHDFAGGQEGATPLGKLLLGLDGSLYGTTARGGLTDCGGGCGTIFRLAADGQVTTLHRFDFYGGSRPRAGLVGAPDGYMYGTTEQGGNGCFFFELPLGCGTVFRVRADGAFGVIHHFDYGATYPQAGLLRAADGFLYGATRSTDLYGQGFGLIYRIDLFPTTITAFSPAQGPIGTRVVLTGTNLNSAVGVTFNGTAAPFRVDSSGRIITRVPIGATSGPIAVITPSGTGTTAANFNVTIRGVALTQLHVFLFAQDGTHSPIDKLIQAQDGTLYSTVLGSGIDGGGIFNITTAGAFTMLQQFPNFGQHVFPWGGLVEGRDGNFYGSTEYGGTGSGNIFQLTPGNVLTSLYSFTGGADGYFPRHDGLVQGSDGAFYGTVQFGGHVAPGSCAYGCGTVFRFVPGEGLQTVYAFTGMDGRSPLAGLTEGQAGNFYGTTNEGGVYGRGVVFVLNASGAFTVLHHFRGPEGAYPKGRVLQASDGNFYGTTTSGGAHNLGTIYRITPTGALTVLYSFGGLDGAAPSAALIQASNGTLYGTTSSGGAYGFGTIYGITLGGQLTTYHSFNGTDGNNPRAALLQASDGALYGTTAQGGSTQCIPSYVECGTVFKLDVP